MTDTQDDTLTEQGLSFYRENLQSILEPEMNGKAVAIHLPSGDFTVAISHTEARKTLRAQHQTNGQTEGYIVSRTIGPSTPTDLDMASRFVSDKRFQQDTFFTQTQIDRMQELMARRDSLTIEERTELEALIDAELDATISRTDHLMSAKQP